VKVVNFTVFRCNSDIDQIEKGIGDKLALLFQYFSAFIAGFVVGFAYGWKLTLVVVSVSPLLALSGIIMGKVGRAYVLSMCLCAFPRCASYKLNDFSLHHGNCVEYVFNSTLYIAKP